MSETEQSASAVTDTSDRTKLVVAGGAFVVAALVALIVLLAAGPGLPAAIAGAVALVLLVIAVIVGRTGAVWHNPELFLPSSEPLALGATSIARFRRRSRMPGSALDAQLRARLRCEEWVKVREGGDTRTLSEEIVDQELEVTVYPDDDVMEADIALAVPMFDAPPTMDLGNSGVSWTVAVEVVAPHAPDDDAEFPVVVAPEVRP